jgi:phosphopantetheinyl transferase (holo-ACP synthase)
MQRRKTQSEEMLAEYNLDYRKARPNRFAKRMEREHHVVLLDPDVAAVFTTQEAVNKALRTLISAMPRSRPRRKDAGT